MTTKNGPLRLFITGTDTSVGKTCITCLIARQVIARGFRVAAYKPVCSGAISSMQATTSSSSITVHQWEDVERLKSAISNEWNDDVICPQRFIAPLAPPIAAKLEGRTVNYEQLIAGANRFSTADLLLIEGAGGWLSPVTETKTVADLASELNAPILIVSRTGLGTINHTLLTIESIRAHGLTVAGIVMNEVVPAGDDTSILTNAIEIEARSGAPVLCTVRHSNSLELLQSGAPVAINWLSLANAT